MSFQPFISKDFPVETTSHIITPIPADVTFDPISLPLDYLDNCTQFLVTNDGTQFDLSFERAVFCAAPTTVNLWGFLRLKCRVTGQTYHLPVPVIQDATVHILNQNHLIGKLDKFKPDTVNIQISRNYEVARNGSLETIAIGGEYLVFNRYYLEIDLMDSLGADAKVLHNFLKIPTPFAAPK